MDLSSEFPGYFDENEVTGLVTDIIFSNPINGYTVAKISDENGVTVTVTGIMPYLSCGESLIASGSYEDNPRFGKQFNIEKCDRYLPDTTEDIFLFLSTGSVKGIGPVIAGLILERFGENALAVMAEDPARLSEIKGISRDSAKLLSRSYREFLSVRELCFFLSRYDADISLAMPLFKEYGEDAEDILNEDPYILTSPLIGGKFSEADSIASALGFSPDSDIRVKAAVLFQLSFNTNFGHCFIPHDKLVFHTAGFLGFEGESGLIERNIDELAEQGRLVRQFYSGYDVCYLPDLLEAESYCASKVRELSSKASHRTDTSRLVENFASLYGIELNGDQKKAADVAINSRISVITGGPGTGKTLIIRLILSTGRILGKTVLAAAPTGRAAKRITELCSAEASTIHRLLGAQFSENSLSTVFSKNEEEPLDCDILIVDEASMIDIRLFEALLKALPEEASLVIIGDSDQLPSVGPGDVLRNLIDSGAVETVRLTKIYRQSESSNIVSFAHMINGNEVPPLSLNEKGFYRIQGYNPELIAQTVTDLYMRRLPVGMKIPLEDIQVLLTTRMGTLGTVSMNARLQEALNPQNGVKNERKFGNVIFREGDKVMQIKNDYLLETEDEITGEKSFGVFNGDIGFISGIDNSNGTLSVSFDGKTAVYKSESLFELEHAWAITVHKSQGSEYKAVIFAPSMQVKKLLTKKILYTAVTRAEDVFVLVAQDELISAMIENRNTGKRYTFLRSRILNGD